MSLEIIRIPEIIEYGTNFSSRWKCAWLPILWEIQSDLFPTNSVDAALTITSVADNGEGLAEFTCSANHLLSRFDWVNVTSSTVTDYEGIEQIVEVSAANIFTLNIPFNATATGSAIKYYNNYHALIEVYGGLPSGHEFEAQDPSLLTTTVKIFFDSNNIAVVDLSRVAQTLINNIFDNNIISWPNVLNFWDQTEILLKESFDQSNGVLVTTKERYGCIKDGGFVTGADWTNGGGGATWTFGGDQASVPLDQTGDSNSKLLTQTILGDALARFSITVTSTFTHTSGTPTLRLIALIGGIFINVQGSTTSQLTVTNTVTGLTINATGVFQLQADITAGSGTDTANVVIDDVEVCIGLANEVVNSKLDFRNGRGGNMLDYIVRDNSTIAKWMTGFVEPTLFIDEYFSLSIIIDGLTFANSKLVIEQLDFSGDPVDSDILVDIDDQGIGVYQLRIDQLGINSLARCIDVTIAVTGGNKLSETKRVCIERECSSQDIYLMWLNQFGGWDSWKFTAEKDFNTDITESQRTEKNIYDNWPKSYNKQSLREESRISGFKSITVRSQHLTAAQADAIGGIKTSMYVLEIKEGLTVSDNVTVLADKNSFQRFNETDDLFTMTFNIRQTDDIATQSN